MILIGVGANLPSPRHGPPRATCGGALAALAEAELSITQRSQWYKSAPQPVSDQPWFVNAVIRVQTALDPTDLLDLLLKTEKSFGRRRGQLNAPRILDLDLLAYGEMVTKKEHSNTGGTGAPVVPHPRMHERPFVLLPLRDVAPGWRHPVSGMSVEDLIQALPEGLEIEIMADANGAYGSEWQAGDPGGGEKQD